MVDVDKAVIARLKVGSEHFEVLVSDTQSAFDFREGKKALEDVLVVDAIFKDARRGLHASEHEMQRLFMTSNIREVASHIIKKGDVQVTVEYQNKIREEKRKQVINLIHRNAIDPRTGVAHPIQRIQNALIEAKINIDYHKSAEEQIQEIVKKLHGILPISYETREIQIRVPASFAARSFSTIKTHARVIESRWEADGSLLATVEVPAGMQSELFDALNHITKGQLESKILRTK